MRTAARLVSLASSGHRFSDVDLDDPNCHVGVIVPDDRKISPISEGVRGYASISSVPKRSGPRVNKWWARVSDRRPRGSS